MRGAACVHRQRRHVQQEPSSPETVAVCDVADADEAHVVETTPRCRSFTGGKSCVPSSSRSPVVST